MIFWLSFNQSSNVFVSHCMFYRYLSLDELRYNLLLYCLVCLASVFLIICLSLNKLPWLDYKVPFCLNNIYVAFFLLFLFCSCCILLHFIENMLLLKDAAFLCEAHESYLGLKYLNNLTLWSFFYMSLIFSPKHSAVQQKLQKLSVHYLLSRQTQLQISWWIKSLQPKSQIFPSEVGKDQKM